jgi:hypothetical protein
MPKDVICFGKCRHMTPRLIANIARVLPPTWFSTLPEPRQKSRNRAGSVSDPSLANSLQLLSDLDRQEPVGGYFERAIPRGPG